MKSNQIAILIRDINNVPEDMRTHYGRPLIKRGLDPKQIGTMSLDYKANGKVPVTLIKECLRKGLKQLEWRGVTTLLVADAPYFKVLTKSRTAEPHHGYILPCKIEGYEHMKVILSISYKSLFYNPTLQFKLDMSLDTMAQYLSGFHRELGSGIIHSVRYPESVSEIKDELNKLHQYPRLACDIEAYSLIFTTAHIGTIAFAWTQNDGIAFCVEVDRLNQNEVLEIQTLLRHFFQTYKGILLYHNGLYDIKILIYELYMRHMQDTAGLIAGLNVMYKRVHDTKIITFLALNTTARLKLDLKSNIFEFAGNYAQDDIKDIRLIARKDLLRYNLTDAIGTIYLFDKNYPIMLRDQQEEIYNEIMIPSMKVITQMELTGLPMDMNQVNNVEHQLEHILEEHKEILDKSETIWAFEDILRMEALLLKQSKLKVKKVTLGDFLGIKYNPASNKQTAKLLYEHFNLPVNDLTDTGLPAVGAGTMKKLLNKLIHEHNITEDELNG